jgi:predicted amidohydrolase YtcJ
LLARYLSAWLLLALSQLSHGKPVADYVLTNAAVYTVDAQESWAQSVAIAGKRIVYVGSNAGSANFIGEKTRVVDLAGRMVLPGFQDAHIHPVSSVLAKSRCSIGPGPGEKHSLALYLEGLAACAQKSPHAGVILGSGWSRLAFAKDKPPTRFMLDAIVSDRPVILTSYDGHSTWANSKAIEAARISAATPDVSSGEISRLPDSREPSGLFVESRAQSLIMQAQPATTDEAIYAALMDAQQYLNSLGITAVQDALISVVDKDDYNTLPAYRRAAQQAALSLRVVGALYWSPDRGLEQLADLKRARSTYSLGQFQATSVKIWLDGTMHTRSAYLLEDYADKPGSSGDTSISANQLPGIVAALDEAGFQLHCHADGDGAVRMCLDAIEFAQKTNGSGSGRHQIVHIELIHPEDIPRFANLGVIANVQPMWSTYAPYISDLIEAKLGASRKPWMEVNRSLVEAGVRVAYGSDWSVTSANPLHLIEAAVTRIRPLLPLQEKRQASPPLPGEQVSLAQAIHGMTAGSAYANHLEDSTGSIEVGKLADIVVLDKNLFEIPALEISQAAVLLTFMDGRLVHGKLPL